MKALGSAMIVAKAFPPKRPAHVGEGGSHPPDSAAHTQEKISAALRQQEGVDVKKKKRKRPRKRKRPGERQQTRARRKHKDKTQHRREVRDNTWKQGAVSMKKKKTQAGEKRSRWR